MIGGEMNPRTGDDPETASSTDAARFRAVLSTLNGALAAAADDDQMTQWARAMRHLGEALDWQRAVLAVEPGWQLAAGETTLRPVDDDEPAFRIARQFPGDGVTFVEGSGPATPLPRGVRGALLVRHGRLALYFEFGEQALLPTADRQKVALRTLRFLGLIGYGPAPAAAPLPGLIGASPAMTEVFAIIRKHADSLAPVYVFGDTGTGKERVARALHDGSPHASGPFVPVNASTLSDELFESEMFGHVKGSFTGAVGDREGFVAQAEGGTLFIDEISDLSLRGQAKMLRFLEEKEYRRLGDPRVRKARVRILTASNKPLEARVAAGLFRADFLFRIDTLAIRLPPLRMREGDIVLLGRHLLQEAATADGKRAPRLVDGAWAALERHDWPGNVRELRGEMYRLVVEHSGRIVHPSHLSPRITARERPDKPYTAARDDFDREYIERTLIECRGNKAHAAQRMGVTRQGLHAKMKRLGVA
jgi:transcriptional regulator with AAA-type ATPase domain